MAGIPLDYEKLPTGGNVSWFWVPAGGLTDVADIQISQVNSPAGYNLSAAISVADTDFGNQASNTNSDPSFADTGNVQDRGASQYGGGVTFYFPKRYDDNTNIYSIAFDLTDADRTPGFWVQRIDGETPNTGALAAGQYVSAYSVLSDAESATVGGEEAQKRTVNFLNQGNLAVYTVARSAAAALTVTSPTLSAAAGAKGRFRASLNGRFYGGASWSSSDPAVIEVFPGGFYTITGATSDTATVTASHNGLTATIAVTVS